MLLTGIAKFRLDIDLPDSVQLSENWDKNDGEETVLS
jgi:hypothetical protein